MAADSAPAPIELALVGIGKIARDQHLPAIAAEPRFRLAAVASRNGRVEGVPNYMSVEDLLAAHPEVKAVSIATPPRGRHAIALAAIAAGRNVMIEKPPGATIGEVDLLADAAREAGVSLFASWHSREAPAVAPARDWVAGRTIRSVAVSWREDVRVWHPGQDWILEPGGLGVFDPGINALSILTALLPFPLILEEAVLGFPAGRQAPLTAELRFEPRIAPVTMSLSFLQEGPQSWDIVIETDGGRLALSDGGMRATVDGKPLAEGANREYPRLYAHFADLIDSGRSDVDRTPLRIVADAFLLGRREELAAFSW